MSSAGSSSKLFVVFGAGPRNIGGALARRLVGSQSDAKIVLVGRNEENMSALKSELGEDKVEWHRIDATQEPSEIDGLFKSFSSPLAGVANCIGSVILKPAHSTSLKEFEDTMRINATSSFNILKSSVKVMQKQESGGSIAFCASAVALHGIQNHEAIAAAKGAIVAMAKSAASSYAKNQIRVNCVAPGLTYSPMTERITSNEAARKASESMHALKRLGTPEEVSAALEFFLDPKNSFVTGQVLAVDGGLSCVQAN